MLGVSADLDPLAAPWLGLHRLSDGLIGLAYVVIAASLALFVWRVRRYLAVRRVVLLSFATFIGACGLTHFSHVLYSFDPRWLPLLLVADAATVVASVATAGFLPFELGRALALLLAGRDDGRAL